jgi:hypothetical protein
MCVIVDADIASILCSNPPHADLTRLIYWIECEDGKIVYSGKLKGELFKIANAKRRLLGWWRAGKALENNDPRIGQEQERLRQEDVCESNDYHILALALVTRVRLLCSHDKKLHADFTNPQVINNPRGHIYQNRSHDRLLRHTRGCMGGS